MKDFVKECKFFIFIRKEKNVNFISCVICLEMYGKRN